MASRSDAATDETVHVAVPDSAAEEADAEEALPEPVRLPDDPGVEPEGQEKSPSRFRLF